MRFKMPNPLVSKISTYIIGLTIFLWILFRVGSPTLFVVSKDSFWLGAVDDQQRENSEWWIIYTLRKTWKHSCSAIGSSIFDRLFSKIIQSEFKLVHSRRVWTCFLSISFVLFITIILDYYKEEDNLLTANGRKNTMYVRKHLSNFSHTFTR